MVKSVLLFLKCVTFEFSQPLKLIHDKAKLN